MLCNCIYWSALRLIKKYISEAKKTRISIENETRRKELEIPNIIFQGSDQIIFHNSQTLLKSYIVKDARSLKTSIRWLICLHFVAKLNVCKLSHIFKTVNVPIIALMCQ